MSDASSPVDPSRCPLCGDDNRCGAVNKSETCWCYTTTFAPGVLAYVPDAAKNKACLCAKCATKPVAIGASTSTSDHRE